MIAILAAGLIVDGSDLDAVSKAALACERGAMNKAAAQETQRHSAFVLDSFREQAAIVAARADLAERRRRLRAIPPGPVEPGADSEASLALIALAVADRQQALDDARMLDGMKRDAFGHFRQLYLNSCQGRGA